MKPESIVVVHGPEIRVAEEINAEREGQKSREGYNDEHDDHHADGSLWSAAHFYVNAALKPPIWLYMNFKKWPWDAQYFKPWKKDAAGNTTTEIDQDRCLIKAGALIIAEQERLERALQKVVGKIAEIRKQKENQ